MTCALISPLTAHALARTLVAARAIDVAITPLAAQLSISRCPATRAADSLRALRRRRGRERTAALGASAAAHPASVQRSRVGYAAAQWITILPRAVRWLRGTVDHDPAGWWITIGVPLKQVCRAEGSRAAARREER